MFTYKVVPLGAEDAKGLETVLNDHGDQEWRFVQIVSNAAQRFLVFEQGKSALKSKFTDPPSER